MAKSRTAQFYATHPESREKKQRYDAALNKKKAQVKKRVESNQKRAEAKKKGIDIRGKDYDHAVGRFVKSSVNRGRRGEGGR